MANLKQSLSGFFSKKFSKDFSKTGQNHKTMKEFQKKDNDKLILSGNCNILEKDTLVFREISKKETKRTKR